MLKPNISLSDGLLASSLLLGLVWSPALVGMLAALPLRNSERRIELGWEYLLFGASAIIGLGVIFSRGIGDSRSLVLQYTFIWALPFLIAYYRPDAGTLRAISGAVYVLFALDLCFNLIGTFIGADLLGRAMDERAGAIGARMGGVFGHSFYSGSISLAALTTILAGGGRRVWFVALPVFNLILAGSWRLASALPIIAIFYFWEYRSAIKEFLVVLLLAALSVLGTLYTGGLLEEGPDVVNESNTLRAAAWILAIDKISESPFVGVGYPRDSEIDGVSLDTIDESLTAESWYLGSAITFGIPYTAFRWLGLFVAFLKQRHRRFVKITCPLILIDMVYGGFFDGTLFLTLLWVQLTWRDSTALTAGKEGRDAES